MGLREMFSRARTLAAQDWPHMTPAGASPTIPPSARICCSSRRAKIAAMFGRVAARYDPHEPRHGRRAGHLVAAPARGRRRRPAPPRACSTSPPAAATSCSRSPARARFPNPPSAPTSACPCSGRRRPRAQKKLLVGDGLHLPFPDATFDAVTIAWGLRNFADRLAGLREMRRVLRPGGHATCWNFPTPSRGWRRAYFWYMRRLMPVYAQFITPRARRL